VTLWHDPETGELSLLNATEDRMPVERIACGTEGAPHAAPLSLPFRAGPAPARLARRCAAGADGVVCRAKKAD
jgi:hypothetical protein